MKSTLMALLLSWGQALGGSPCLAATKTERRGLEGFDIAKEPAPADWRFFIKAPEASRMQLWTYHTKRGKNLGAWAWGWRLGWVRVCAKSNESYCAAILHVALFDKALVVRAEAATRIGDRFEGTANETTVTLLKRAFANPRNVRSGRPLFVQNRILFALKQVGGDDALAVGTELAERQRELKTYWLALTKVN